MMGIRTFIDLFIADKLGKSEGFADGLNKLVSEKHLTPRSKEILEAAVNAGHAVSHRSYCPTDKDLNTAMDIIENLIQPELLARSALDLQRVTPKRENKS